MAAKRGRGRFGGHHAPPFGPWGGPGGGPFGSGPRVRRGDVRTAVLAILAEQPRNGYQLIQEIAQRSGGVWRPSAGSVYPALQQLEDEGLVRALSEGSGRVCELTDEGRRHVEADPDQYAAPWETVAGTVDEQAVELRDLVGQLAAAAVQVSRAGSTTHAAEARRVLTDARRSLYRLLAEEPDEDHDDS
jgi:DNA-binding PadR family transcriptional regulator